jgi:predicted enzyme related to lactoylglutathione lyase
MHPICVQTVYVPDLPTALRFYTTALGYEVEQTYGPCIAQLATSSTTLILQEIDPEQADRLKPCVAMAFQTDNILGSMQQVLQNGGTLLHNTPQPCPVGLYVQFTDPAGVLHELLEFGDAAPA